LERIIVGEDLGGSISVNVDKSIVFDLFRILVDHTTRENWRHQGPIKHWDLSEDTRSWLIAAVFAEKHRDRRITEI